MNIVFFSLYSGLWAHAFPEAIIAESLQKSGHNVTYLGCGKILDYCLVMDNFGIKPHQTMSEKRRICAVCQDRKQLLRNNLKLKGSDIADVLDENDGRWIDLVMAGVTKENYMDFYLDKIPIGKISVFHVLIHRKKINLNLSSDEWSEFKTEFKSCLKVYQYAHKIMSNTPPDRVIVYNSNYPLNRIFSMVSQQYGVDVYTMHAGMNHSDRYSAMIMHKHTGHEFLYDICAYWTKIKFTPCSQKALKKVTDHLLGLFDGKSVFVYSSKKDTTSVRDRFQIKSDQKIVVALLSSYDERFACEIIETMHKDPDIIFKTQVDWVQSIIKYFSNRREITLIIRVHPREFPNKRDPLKSQHAINLAKELVGLPTNVIVNWPTDNVSLYDLAEETALFLNAWSSTGKEMALLGLPVVLYSKKLPMYPYSLNEVGDNEKDYFQKIEYALNESWNFERIRMAYRWCVLEFVRSQMEFPESYGDPFSYKNSLFKRIVLKVSRYIDRNFIEKVNVIFRSNTLKESSKIHKLLEESLDGFYCIDSPEDTASSVEEETKYLNEELLRLFNVMYPKRKKYTKGSLYKNMNEYLSRQIESID